METFQTCLYILLQIHDNVDNNAKMNGAFAVSINIKTVIKAF